MLVILPKIELEQIKSIKHSTLISLASGMRIASGMGNSGAGRAGTAALMVAADGTGDQLGVAVGSGLPLGGRARSPLVMTKKCSAPPAPLSVLVPQCAEMGCDH
jgi:hypothetical protein